MVIVPMQFFWKMESSCWNKRIKMLKKTMSIFLTVVLLSFAVPASAVVTSTAVLSDTPSAWAQSDIAQAISLGLVPDDLQNAYTKPITRQEFCRLIVGLCDAWHIAGKTETAEQIAVERGINTAQTTFNDTDAPEVNLCAAFGIVVGRGNGIFDPAASITRQEAAKVLYKAAECLSSLMESTDSKTMPAAFYPHIFSDSVLIHNYARTAINWTFHMGVMLGVTGNAFDPNGTYTREQADITVLRLYNSLVDPVENSIPEPEYYTYGDGYIDSYGNTYTKDQKGYVYPFDQPYKIIRDNEGTGANYSHIIDKTGQTLLTDIDDSDGIFRCLSVYGNLAMFLGANWLCVVNLKTGAAYQNAYIASPSDGMIRLYQGEKVGYMDMEGNLIIEPKYNANNSGDFYNGKALVQLQDGTWNLIDKTGKALKQNILKAIKETVPTSNNRYGENLLLQNSSEKYAIYSATTGYLTAFDYEAIVALDNGEFIGLKNTSVLLIDKTGKQVSTMYPEYAWSDYRKVDDNHFLIKTEPNIYAFVDGTGRELTTLPLTDLYSLSGDDGGLYIYQKDATHCVIIDSQGIVLSTITRDYTIGTYGFENGLVYIENDWSLRDKDNVPLNLDPTYYFPDGTLAFQEPNTKIPRDIRLNWDPTKFITN